MRGSLPAGRKEFRNEPELEPKGKVNERRNNAPETEAWSPFKAREMRPPASRNSVLHVPLSRCGSAALIVISAGVFLQVPGGLALRLSARLPQLAARSRLWIQPYLIFSRFMQFSCLFPLLVTNFLLDKMKIKSNDFYAYIQLLNIHCLS